MSLGAYLTCEITFGGGQKAEAHYNFGTTPGEIDLHHLMAMDETTREFKHYFHVDDLEVSAVADIVRQIKENRANGYRDHQ